MGHVVDRSRAMSIRESMPVETGDRLDQEGERNGKRVSVAVIDSRNLDRDCLVRTISSSYPDIHATGYSSIGEWRRAGEASLTQVIIYRHCLPSGAKVQATEELDLLVKEASPVPIVVVGDSEDIRAMIEAFNCGARGYVPSSVGLDAIAEATRLSFTTGVFLPITSIVALRDAFVAAARQETELSGRFTGRQLAVCEALRRGMSNKSIAYELNLCESTVKVHIRSIMKKLNATNRTEAAFKLNAVCFGNRG